eukprot:scaffold138381_cov36-Tisochrysis_lutea.AAC.9
MPVVTCAMQAVRIAPLIRVISPTRIVIPASVRVPAFFAVSFGAPFVITMLTVTRPAIRLGWLAQRRRVWMAQLLPLIEFEASRWLMVWRVRPRLAYLSAVRPLHRRHGPRMPYLIALLGRHGLAGQRVELVLPVRRPSRHP